MNLGDVVYVPLVKSYGRVIGTHQGPGITAKAKRVRLETGKLLVVPNSWGELAVPTDTFGRWCTTSRVELR